MANTSEYIQVEKVALRLITRAEQCTSGLSRKLQKRGYDPDCINKVISDLTEKGLLNDSRFSRFWLQSRIRLTRSPRRLLSSLCARGIDHDDAEAVLKEVLNEEDVEFTMLVKFVKKYGKKAGSEPRFLKYMLKNEGFSLTAIQRFLGEE
ncbi:MAG: recombination regulator RecX [Treponema sp.]|nr:recombination regulator RecX [Treponema sp.]